MTAADDNELARRLRRDVITLQEPERDLDPLLERIGDASFVLLGEASHGTHDFYRVRAEITKRLIREKGYNLVAAEADWPDAYRVNRYVRGVTRDLSSQECLSSFERFPAWMWRNADVLDFVGWLREHNDQAGNYAAKVGFYGMDLYSLHASIDAVLAYLERTDPELARDARARYACFDLFGEDPQFYGYATSVARAPSCEDEVVEQLASLQRERATLLGQDGLLSEDEFLFAEQNANVVKNAERYYRAMYRGGISSWNLRDLHMADTVDALVAHARRRQESAKVVLWAHNSHLGDARATEMGEHGEWNLGQLMRERHGGDAVLVGFSSYAGSVTAASDWGGPAERKVLRKGLAGSYEALFHQVGLAKFLLLFDRTACAEELNQARLARAVGVVYRPETERQSHYYHARLTAQFDALLHLDHTRALEPLERTAEWQEGELPDTYPTGI